MAIRNIFSVTDIPHIERSLFSQFKGLIIIELTVRTIRSIYVSTKFFFMFFWGCLFQVWCEKDFLFLKKKLNSIYPYSHYFKRSVMIYNAWKWHTTTFLLKLLEMHKPIWIRAQIKMKLLIFSGFIGSGLAVFSRHRIHDAFLYRYSLNGYPYMVSLISCMHKHPALLLKYKNKERKNSI